MRTPIWISYDLGVSGDYEGLYSWLDTHGAKECGSSVAFLQYNHAGDLMTGLANDIESAVSLDKRSRIYVVRRDGERVAGRFVIGNRKAAPWEGFGDNGDTSDDCA